MAQFKMLVIIRFLLLLQREFISFYEIVAFETKF